MALAWSGQEGINPNCTAMGFPPPECQQFGTIGEIYYGNPVNTTWFSDGLGVYDSDSGIYDPDTTSSG